MTPQDHSQEVLSPPRPSSGGTWTLWEGTIRFPTRGFQSFGTSDGLGRVVLWSLTSSDVEHPADGRRPRPLRVGVGVLVPPHLPPAFISDFRGESSILAMFSGMFAGPCVLFCIGSVDSRAGGTEVQLPTASVHTTE